MGNHIIYSIYLNNGTVISFCKKYKYSEKAAMIEKIKDASEDDILNFYGMEGEELLIPKRSIQFLKISPDEDTKEVI